MVDTNRNQTFHQILIEGEEHQKLQKSKNTCKLESMQVSIWIYVINISHLIKYIDKDYIEKVNIYCV